jgi:hypothetical protein
MNCDHKFHHTPKAEFTLCTWTSTTSCILEKLDQLQAALESLESHNVTVSQLVLSLLQDPRLQNQAAVDNLVSHTTEILMALADNSRT